MSPLATATRPLTTTSAADGVTPLWDYQQIATEYRFVAANNPLGFIFQMRTPDEYGHFGKWQTTDSIPAMVVRPLLVQCGILQGITAVPGTNGSPTTTAAHATKAPTAARGKVNVQRAASGNS